MFKYIFGDNPHTKILEFLANHTRYDYNMSDISKFSGVSRPTTYRVIEYLLKNKLVVKTREMRNSPMYKLNTETEIVRKILKLDFEIGKMIADLEDNKDIQKLEKAIS